MTCRDIQGLTGNFLDGELIEELSDRVQRHLLRCSACREEVESLRMAVQVLKLTHAPATPGEAFVSAALERLRRELDIANRLPEPPGQLVLGIGR